MSIRNNYKYTIYACYIGYIVQSIICNISPILFATYQQSLGVPIQKIGLLIGINFGMQLVVDFAAARYVDRFGYRKCMIFAHITAVIGIAGIGVLPFVLPDPFAGLVIATLLNSIGGGLLEVMVSPMVEAAPIEEKTSAMSMLHSFYSWGCVGFILISTLLLRIVGGERWFILPLLWAVVPLINCFVFTVVPVYDLFEEKDNSDLRSLAKQKIFWILVLFMLCSGAAEQAMAQWTSYFAEIGLNVNKTVGDLLGPCTFCFMMGLTRLFFGKKGESIRLERFMKFSCVLCIAAYLIAVFSTIHILSLIGCGISGLAVGIFWPGTLSVASGRCKNGGTAMFAMLALAGDLGCAAGPGLVRHINIVTDSTTLNHGISNSVFN